MSKIIYISGAISNEDPEKVRENLNHFFRIEDELKIAGFECGNPASWEEKGIKSWEYYMQRDLTWIKENKPNAIFMLNNWRTSKGAIRELELAIKLGIEVVFEDESLENKDLLK